VKEAAENKRLDQMDALNRHFSLRDGSELNFFRLKVNYLEKSQSKALALTFIDVSESVLLDCYKAHYFYLVQQNLKTSKGLLKVLSSHEHNSVALK
jgi:hypothetical protein